MAILQVFTVFDSAIGAYAAPFFMKSRGEALRAFTTTAQDTNSNIWRHPQDYALFHLGQYDEETGVFTQDHPPLHLGLAQEFQTPPPEQAVPNGQDGQHA